MSGIIAVYGLVVSVLIAGGRASVICLSTAGTLAKSTSRSGSPKRIFSLCGIHPSSRWACMWLHGASCGVCDRDSRRLCEFQSFALLCAFSSKSWALQCVRAYLHEAKVFVAMVLILIFAEVLGLYGHVHSIVAQFTYI